MALEVGDKIEFEHVIWGRDFNGDLTVFISWTVVPATITRVWERGPNVTLCTLDGQIFVRDRRSESIWPAPKVNIP
jgi:hypothetical protein